MLFGKLAVESSDGAVRAEAISALAAAPSSEAARKLFALWSRLNYPQRHAALDRLASSKTGAEAIMSAADKGDLPKKTNRINNSQDSVKRSREQLAVKIA